MLKLLFPALLLLLCSACATTPYTYGTAGIDEGDGDSRNVSQQIRIGKPSAFLDASDWYWPGSLLSKLVLWNRNVDSHQITDETVEALRLYLERNQLDDVQVLVNAYSPGTQWSRLFQNREVGAFWRYTFGIVSTAYYTIMPGRFFGGDHYNPYTNTLSIYSDIPAVSLHEGGHAKDFNSRKYKGLYAALYAIPGVPLYHEAVASNDALSYLYDQCQSNERKKAYRILHPAYGTYVGGTFSPVTSKPVTALAAIPGHITGAIAAWNVEEAAACTPPPQHIENRRSTEGK